MDGEMLSVLFVPRHVPVPGTHMTPHRSLEPDQMETLVKPWRLIRRVSAKGSGLDGERKDKCVLSGKGPGEAPRCSLGGLGSRQVRAGHSDTRDGQAWLFSSWRWTCCLSWSLTLAYLSCPFLTKVSTSAT